MIKYVHTNIVAIDFRSLSAFYQSALGCLPMQQARDLRGDRLDLVTGLTDVHIVGEHPLLPG